MGSHGTDFKPNGIVYIGAVREPTRKHSGKSPCTPNRAPAFLAIERLKEESFDIIDKCENQNIHPYEYSNADSFRMRQRFEPSMNGNQLLNCTERDDSKVNGRTFKSKYLYDHDVGAHGDLGGANGFRERLQKVHVHHSNMRKSFSRCRYSESEKDNNIIVADTVDPIRRRIRARSESEPNDIRNMREWPASNKCEFPRNNLNAKRLCEEQNASDKSRNQTTIMKRDPPSASLRKKESPPRILVYNNSPRANSPAQMKKAMRHRASPVLGSPRLNRVRRSKPKSCSPNVIQTYSATSASKSNTQFRKSKSATPPPRRTSTEVVVKKISPRRQVSFNKISDTESSVGDEEEDDFFDDDLSDNENVNSSSDSEIAYKTHVYAHNDKSSSPLVTKDSPLRGQETAHFVASLFPHVPPYISFSSHIENRPSMPPFLFKILKWRLTTVMPKLVRRIVMNSGFRLLKKTNDWMGTWGKHMKSPCFKTVRSYQKFNHIPGSFKIGRKDSCWRNLQAQMMKYGSKEFGFMPKTYIIPQDLKMLRRSWPKYSQRNVKWIIKPPASARGTGIKVINRWAQIPKRKPVIVQRYIEKPFLINGSKFDLRLYVLVTSINPLRVYMHQDGLVRFASVKYSEKADTLNDRYMHLTNYSINKLSSTYSQNKDVNACKGHKWTIQSLWAYLRGRGINTTKLWDTLRNLVLRTLLAGENSINAMCKMNIESKYNCFELFGFDVILDSELVPWLLEVNISPSLHSELPLDLHVKAPLVQAVLNTALYHVPPKLTHEQQKTVLSQEGLSGSLCYDKRMYITYLSREEKIKHNQFTRKSVESRDDYLNAILENLTPDDIRCLMIAEDELQRSAPLERIFPGPNTHKYLKYTETPRYYNRLLDAWEHKFNRNRNEGIRVLQELCKQKQHLEIPAQPARKDSNVDADTATIVVAPQDSCKFDKTEKQETTGNNTGKNTVKLNEKFGNTETICSDCTCKQQKFR